LIAIISYGQFKEESKKPGFSVHEFQPDSPRIFCFIFIDLGVQLHFYLFEFPHL